ncbi:hypothetical protein [Aquisalimonas asiatica]|uniref:hypothetical protein n=1 Tax=Aquisalimonas asiatica TaxID=406100 RepID=UPI00111439BE|nr:hypothetical protein [Aquisalimonas asiatica]
MAALKAPATLLLSLLALLALTACAARFGFNGRPMACYWFSLDVESGCVWADSVDGIRAWQLRSWFRHPALCVLYLRGENGTSATLVLPRDALDRRCARRLYYLLGVSTVGNASGSLSG